ncbi:MAG: protein-glutamine glutaminase family protein [Bacteriovoracia bacterium]
MRLNFRLNLNGFERQNGDERSKFARTFADKHMMALRFLPAAWLITSLVISGARAEAGPPENYRMSADVENSRREVAGRFEIRLDPGTGKFEFTLIPKEGLWNKVILKDVSEEHLRSHLPEMIAQMEQLLPTDTAPFASSRTRERQAALDAAKDKLPRLQAWATESTNLIIRNFFRDSLEQPAEIEHALQVLDPPEYYCELRKEGFPARRQYPTQRVPEAETKTDVSVLTPEEAAGLFRALQNDPAIPYRFTLDGCYARAHEMARNMEALGIQAGKVWLTNFKFNRDGKPEPQGVTLSVPNPQYPTCTIEWSYHVAPVVYVKASDQRAPVLMVLDPSLFHEPVPVSKWMTAQTSKGEPTKFGLYVTERYPYNPGQIQQDFNRPPKGADAEAERVLGAYREALKHADALTGLKPSPATGSPTNTVPPEPSPIPEP